LKSLDCARVAAIEAIRYSKQRRQALYLVSHRLAQRSEISMFFPGCISAMIAGDIGDHYLLTWRHPKQLRMQNQVVRMLVVPVVADVIPNVMKQGSISQRLPVACFAAEKRRECVIQLQRKVAHV
jgi:hypothetical protein